MFKYLLLNQLKRTSRYFSKRSAAKIITSFLFIIIFSFIAYGIYRFFELGFYFISANEQDLYPLLLYFYEIFFIVLGAIIFFSSLVTGMFSLWRGKNDSWFVSSSNYKYLPRFVFAKGLLSGIWPLFVVFIPVVLSLDKVFNISLLDIFSILFSFILYLVLMSGLAFLLIIYVAYIFKAVSSKYKNVKFTFGRLFLVLLVFVLLGSGFVWKNYLSIDVIDLFRANYYNTPEVLISSISEHFLYIPSHLLAMNTLNSQIGSGLGGYSYLFILFIFSFLVYFFWWKSAPLFLPIWQKLKEGSGLEASDFPGGKKNKFTFLFKGPQTAALLKKEMLLFIRNPRNIIWFSFLLFIWLIQASINLSLAKTINVNELEPSLQQTAIQSFQFVVAIYFISAFVLRFVFPSFSSEGKTLWILSSSPMNMTKIFYTKYLFFSLFFLILGLALGYLNLVGLNLDWFYVVESLLMFSVATAFITALGLSLGAVFPNYDTDDPGVISTTLPGISLIILSLGYGTLGGLVIYLSQQSLNKLFIYLFIFTSLILIALILFIVPKLIHRRNKPRGVVS